MIARTNVSQRIEGIVGAFASCRAIAESQMRERARIDQTRLNGNRAGDRDAKLNRCRLSHGQGFANLLNGWEQFIKMRPPASTGVESVEHDGARPKSESQFDRLVKMPDIQAGRDEGGHNLSVMQTDMGHRGQDRIPGTRRGRQPIVGFPLMAEQRQFEERDVHY